MKSLLVVMSLMCALFLPSMALSAQDDSSASTPEAAPANVQFGIVPVGDYPDGYFSDTEVEPGSTAKFRMQVVNVGTEPVALNLYAANAYNGENGGFLPGSQGEPLTGSAAWIAFDVETLNVEPNTATEINLTVTVPQDAQPGQYISAIVAETSEALDVEDSEMFRQILRSAMSISIVVPGEQVFDFELGQPIVEESIVRVPVVNTGNFLVKPSGSVEIVDADGRVVATQDINMGSVYAGNESSIAIYLPDHVASGDYHVNAQLQDADSGATAEIDDERIAIAEGNDDAGLRLVSATVTPNADDISFATVSFELENSGEDLPAVDLTLHVFLDGEEIDAYPLASDQLFRQGDYSIETRFIPADLWQSGTYTFRLTVESVGEDGDQRILLLDEDLDAEITVP